jgi:triosephosphate isomerase
MKPLIIINFKTYKQGNEALKLAKIIEKIDKNIIIGVEPSDICLISKKTNLKIFAQHVDPFEPGRYTGYIIHEAIKKDGAIGSFLNHSEHPLNFKTIKKTISLCKKIRLKTAVFAKSLSEAKKIESLKPDYLIYEPPELVAGNISISTSKPEIIARIAHELKTPFLVGAGIKTNEDVKKSLELGAIGIAISSAITTAKNPGKVLKELICK